MAIRLGDLVIEGELFQTRPYSVHGWIRLRGNDLPMLFELTGSPSADLRGRCFHFQVPAHDVPPTDEDRRRATSLRDRQIGPTGEMTATRQVRILDDDDDEPSSERWAPVLYLEWFGQNGRVVFEVPEAQIRFFDLAERRAEDRARVEEENQAQLAQGDDPAAADDNAPFFDALEPGDEESADEDDDEDYGLIPAELDRELERAAHRTDRAIRGETQTEDANRAIEECELMDEVIERGVGTPILELLADLALPAPADVTTEEQAERALKPALAALALYGVAFDVCKHCSPTEAYRIFIERVCPKCSVFPQMRGTGWVQHFTTHDFCARCDAEFESDFPV